MSRAPPRLPTHATPATRHAPLPMPSPRLARACPRAPHFPATFPRAHAPSSTSAPRVCCPRHARPTPVHLPAAPTSPAAHALSQRPAPVYAWPACSTTIFSPRHARLSHTPLLPLHTRHVTSPSPLRAAPTVPFRIHLAPAPFSHARSTPAAPSSRPCAATPVLSRIRLDTLVPLRVDITVSHRVPRIGSAPSVCTRTRLRVDMPIQRCDHIAAAPFPAAAPASPAAPVPFCLNVAAALCPRPLVLRHLRCPIPPHATPPRHRLPCTPLRITSLRRPLIRTIVRAIVRDLRHRHDISTACT
ncbi:hypothetical protein B0H14DRAFT_1304257 [Mycena olivaceomarginata]|nr:hypothetical protein B0H14DRAFT_1304257 [Mycena olivaceomarginata]